MQLKGLVRFFTVLLILYSIYELSFTWVVRSHERKMEAKAKQYVASVAPNADSLTYQKLYQERLKRLLDSTSDVTVHYGPTGAISYEEAKKNELNLGLDLKGGINVTMAVDLSGLLRTLSNNSQDPAFLQALQNANAKKINSNSNFVTLFRDEYKKINPNGRLAALFSAGSGDKIKPGDSDDKVMSEISKASSDAFENTFNVLKTRIDQFGVAQPNINPDRARDIITVELPGVQDPERVRNFLQNSANLQFWSVYKDEEVANFWAAADKAYNNYMIGARTDSAKTAFDSTGKAIADSGIAKRTADSSKKVEHSIFRDYLKSGVEGRPAVAVKDSEAFRKIINEVIAKVFPPDARFMYGVPSKEGNKDNKAVPLYIIKSTKGGDKPDIQGDVVTDARMVFDPTTNKPTVSMNMNFTGAVEWEKLTGISHDKKMPIAIVLDDIVYSAPIANDGAISGGKTSISGNFTQQEATDLAKILTIGRLSAPPRIVQEQVVGPTLGQDAINGGMKAFIFSFIVIFLLMLIYYNTAGWIANIALILNLLFTIGVLTGLGATLTAPGIAGLVLTIGMAVDTNVIIYERIKEELTKGKSYPQAVNEGYKRSLPPVLDAHVTTLLTAIILFSFGLGPVKGFATTQIIGILLSLFCGILVSRWVSDWFTNKKRHLEYFTPISKRIFKHASFKFIEYRKVAYAISFVVLAAGIGAMFNGFDQGVEFKGGHSFIVKFDRDVTGNIKQIGESLRKPFGDPPVIKTIGSNDQLDITTAYMNGVKGADSLIRAKLLTGLSTFGSPQIIGSTTVEPTISDKLKSDAKWATFWSLMIIALYIFIRFRDWRYSLGTIVALLHDVLVTLAVFSFARTIVPFPLELDQHFIAAVLTVIGFSMNDTVIVFDRIREYSRQMVGAPKATIINKAINDTLSRTIMTSLTVFLTILILFIVGGEVTKGFAFAMLIGVITGTYSSVFVAAPILVDLGGKKALGSEPSNAKTQTKVKPIAVKH